MIIFSILTLLIYCLVELFLIAVSLIKKNRLNFVSTTVILGAFCLLLFLNYRFGLRIPYYIIFLAMLASFIHTFFGEYLNCYNRSRVFDRYLHAFGTFSASLLTYYLLISVTASGGSKLFRAMLILFLGAGLGSMFEVFEYAMDTKHKTHMQRGLKDTDTDMISNIIGSVAAAIFAYYIFL